MTQDEEDQAEVERILRDIRERPMQWIEDENQRPVAIADPMFWARWMELPGNRIVAQDKVKIMYGIGGHYLVSTVFLGIDHNFGFRGPPILYETMVFHESTVKGWAERSTRVRKILRKLRRWRMQGLIRDGFIPWLQRQIPSGLVHSIDMHTQRYRTREAARIGHVEILAVVRSGHGAMFDYEEEEDSD